MVGWNVLKFWGVVCCGSKMCCIVFGNDPTTPDINIIFLLKLAKIVGLDDKLH